MTCGQGFTAVLTKEGKLYTFGDSGSRCLGDANGKRRPQPTLVEDVKDIEFDFLNASCKHVVAFTK